MTGSRLLLLAHLSITAGTTGQTREIHVRWENKKKSPKNPKDAEEERSGLKELLYS